MDNGIGCLILVVIGLLLVGLGYAVGVGLKAANGNLNMYGIVTMAVGAFIVIVSLLVALLSALRTN